MGTRKEAEELKTKAKEYLREELKLNVEKSKITHLGKDRASFLGYDIKIDRPKTGLAPRGSKKGQKSNRSLGKPKLLVSKERLRKALINKGIARADGRPKAVGMFIFLPDEEMIIRFSSITRGILNYYAVAENRYELNEAMYIIKYSLLHTLAAKHKTTLKKTINKYGKIPTVLVPRKEGKVPVKFHMPPSLSAAYLSKRYPINKNNLREPLERINLSPC